MPQDRPTVTSATEGTGPIVSIRGMGVGIETVSSFPETDNYSEHEFYRARFTPAELAYGGEQQAPRSSFCALAAVKRAVVKSGAAIGAPEALGAIEIGSDEAGRPTYPDCTLSVDWSETIAVAVCLWTKPEAGLPAPAASVPARAGRTLASFPPLQRLGIRIFMGIVALSLLFIFGAGAWFILNHVFR